MNCWYLLSKDPPLLPSGKPPALQLSRVFSKSNGSLQLYLHYKHVPQCRFHGERSDKIFVIFCIDPAQLRCRKECCRDRACWESNERKSGKEQAFIKKKFYTNTPHKDVLVQDVLPSIPARICSLYSSVPRNTTVTWKL